MVIMTPLVSTRRTTPALASAMYKLPFASTTRPLGKYSPPLVAGRVVKALGWPMIRAGGCRLLKVALVAFFQASIRLFKVSAT